MPLLNGRDFLEFVLSQPQDADLAAQVQEIVNRRVPEDTWLDYKAGAWTTAVDTSELRKDVTGFGNSDGGCLVIGVDETGTRPTGFSSCAGDLARAIQQVHGVLTSIAGSLLPPPRAPRHLRLTTGEDVLVIAIPRSARMAQITDRGHAAYYLRVGDGTARAPEWLLADLFFGRRQQPELALHHIASNRQLVEIDQQSVSVQLQIENAGLTHVHEIYGGALYWAGRSHGGRYIADHSPLHQKAEWREAHLGLRRAVQQFTFSSTDLPPFENTDVMFHARMPWNSHRADWTSVVYIGSASSPPAWWEVKCDLRGGINTIPTTVVPVWDRLPLVHFEDHRPARR